MNGEPNSTDRQTNSSNLKEPHQAQAKHKIAVLGGGLGSLSAIFELTERENWQDDYEITVYQLGWRLGGKGASGRNMLLKPGELKPNYRIQEHGYHVFFGFYKNAFSLMDRCYKALTVDNLFKSVEDAFEPLNHVLLQELENDTWIPWQINYPTNDLVPWQSNQESISVEWTYLQTVFRALVDVYIESLQRITISQSKDPVSILKSIFQNGKMWEVGQSAFDLISVIIGESLSVWDMALLALVSKLQKSRLLNLNCQELVDVVHNLQSGQEILSSNEMEKRFPEMNLEVKRLLIINNLASALIK